MSVGAEIKRRREAANMTQDELARVVCVSQGAIAQFERGYTLPSLATLCRIADVLKTTPAALLTDGTSKEVRE